MPLLWKTLNATNRLFIHLKIQPQKGGWNTETCPKLIPEDTPRDKWAKLILRMKGNIPEIKLREWEHKHTEEKTIIMHTKAAERQRKKEKEKEHQKSQTAKESEDEPLETGREEKRKNRKEPRKGQWK